MPQIFKIGSYVVFFWIGEGNPIEPVHVHVSEGTPTANATKIWITKSGKTLLANNNSDIAAVTLRKLLRVIEANTDDICKNGINILVKLVFTANINTTIRLRFTNWRQRTTIMYIIRKRQMKLSLFLRMGTFGHIFIRVEKSTLKGRWERREQRKIGAASALKLEDFI